MLFSDAILGFDYPAAAVLMMTLNGLFAVLATVGGILYVVITVASVLFGKKITPETALASLGADAGACGGQERGGGAAR